MTQLSLDGRVAFVTGAETPVGAVVAAELARSGAEVAVQYLTSFSQAKQLVRDIARAGGQAVAIKADLQDRAQTELLCKKAGGAFGDIDVAVVTEPDHPAVSLRTAGDPVAELADEVQRWLRACLGPLYAVLPDMLGRGSGVLVYVAGAEPPGPDPVRAVARAAVAAALDQLAAQYASFGITTHLVTAGAAGEDIGPRIALLACGGPATGARA